MAFDDDRDPTLDALDDAIARHYAKQEAGLPPMPPAPSPADIHAKLIAYRRRMREQYPEHFGAPGVRPGPW